MTKLAMVGPAVILSLACLVTPDSLSAEELSGTNPTLTREVRNSIGASFNPLGLQDVLDVSWKRSLSASRNPLFSEAHVSFGLIDARPKLAFASEEIFQESRGYTCFQGSA